MQTTTLEQTEKTQYKEYAAYKVYRLLEAVSKQAGRLMYGVSFAPWYDGNGACVEFRMNFLNGKIFIFRYGIDNHTTRGRITSPNSIINDILRTLGNIGKAYEESFIDMWFAVADGKRTMFIPDNKYTVNSIKKYNNDFLQLRDLIDDFKIFQQGYKLLEK